MLVLILTAALLALPATALEYQSYGEFTRAQLTQTVKMVQEVLEEESGNKALAIAERLNEAMDPSWFVVYMDKSNNFDAIMMVYGYAFKNHWMWLSNFVGAKSVVLWKDYNCDQYVNRTETNFNTQLLADPATFPSHPNALEREGLTRLQLFSQVSSQYLSETWKLIFDITTAVNNNQNQYAYSGFAVEIPVEDIVIPEFSYCVCRKREEYDTLLMFEVKVKDYKDEVAARNFIILMRTR